jgi:acetolactate synthase-1/2/3 large subunit
MKNCDVLAKVLSQAGLQDFFAVTGGAAINIIDSLITTGGMTPYFHHHEQAAALAADAYARSKGLGLCVVTTGPGVTNALTGLLCSWQDSVPCIYISGQARSSQTALGSKVRQVGTQHMEVLPVVTNLTKKAYMLNEKDNIEEVLLDLISIATSGKKGPVWLDIPLDVQLKSRNPSAVVDLNPNKRSIDNDSLLAKNEILKGLKYAVRPIFIFGRGLAGFEQKNFESIIKKINIPILRTWGFLDTNLIIPEQNYFGVIGVSGQRGANFIVSQADYVISIGVRWGQAVVGPKIESFAPNAKVIVVDIDENELKQLTEHQNFELICCNALTLLGAILDQKAFDFAADKKWHEYCSEIKLYNYEQITQKRIDLVDQYQIINLIQQLVSKPTTFVIDGGGTIVYCSMQILNTSKDIHILIPSASCPMGTGLPQSIGSQIAKRSDLVITIIGDGSFAFNLQELQTIKTHKLPIKIVVLNNGGYLSIKDTQKKFQDGRFFGSDKSGGLELPSIAKIARAFGIKYRRINRFSAAKIRLSKALSTNVPEIIEVVVDDNQAIYPTLAFEKHVSGVNNPQPLSRMHPRVELPLYNYPN